MKLKIPQSSRLLYLKQYGWFGFLVSVFVTGLCLQVTNQIKLLEIFFSTACLLGLVPVVIEMIKAVIRGKLGVDLIAVIAVLAALYLGEFWAAMVIMLMLTGGQGLETYAQNRAQQELTDLLRRSPKIAHLKIDNQIQDVAVDRIKPDDQLLVKPGESIPVDGVVINGVGSLDESALTGESLPVEIGVGSIVLSGAINADSAIEIRATKTSHNSQYEQIIHLVREAASSHSPLVRLADQYTIPFTLTAFTLAGIAWFLSGQPVRALEVLVVATPCPLLIATPVAIVAGMSRAARDGIIIKNGQALESLARLKTIAFDKTGTLTRSHPVIESVQAFGMTQAKLLKYAASLEQQSNHILARAIVSAAKSHSNHLFSVSQVMESAGRGLIGQINNHQLMSGSYKFMLTQNVGGLNQIKTVKKSDILVALDNHLIGVITFGEEIRHETAVTLKKLTKLGIEQVLMITGDKHQAAQSIADQIGIAEVHSECLPNDKLSVLKQIPISKRPVGMVGDGVNDAPTLAAADVGIALGAKGSTAASESAGVVIMLDDLRRVPQALRIAQHTMLVARQSIITGLSLSIGLMLLATFSGLRPVYGALLQELIDVTVIFNALRARRP